MVSRAVFTWAGVGERHASGMHSKLKQQKCDNRQLAPAKKALGMSRGSERKGKDIVKMKDARKQFIIIVPEKIPPLCSC